MKIFGGNKKNCLYLQRNQKQTTNEGCLLRLQEFFIYRYKRNLLGDRDGVLRNTNSFICNVFMKVPPDWKGGALSGTNKTRTQKVWSRCPPLLCPYVSK